MSHIVRPLRGRGAWTVLGIALLLFTTAMNRPPVGHIEGTVRDAAGAPIANAQVFVVGTAINALTDRAGHFRLAKIPTGRRSVRAAFIGYRTMQVDSVPVLAGQTTVVNLILQATTPFRSPRVRRRPG
jgi:hypothetical protein